MYCRCGARKARLHFFFCRIAKRRVPRPPGPPNKVLPELLGTHAGLKTLEKWLGQTRFFTDICPRIPPGTDPVKNVYGVKHYQRLIEEDNHGATRG